MRIPFVVLAVGALVLTGCRKKDAVDTGGSTGGGICRTPEADIGWYCVEYSGSDWTYLDAEEDCAEVYVDGEWAFTGACDAGMLGTCDIQPDTTDAVSVHMYGLEDAVAEAACGELGGAWTAA